MAFAGVFRQFIRKYIDDHGCVGRNLWTWDNEGQSLPRFVPRRALEQFWTPQNILDVLCAGEIIHADINLIRDKYLIVFSILVDREPPKPEWITTLMSAESKLDDSHLPITTIPTEWTEVPQNKQILEEIQKYQWKFCPLTFDRGRQSMLQLNPYHIVPIVSQSLIDPKADKEEDDVLLYEAVWHKDCLGDFLPQKVVHKVYHNREQDIADICQNEVDVYTSLPDTEKAFEHIVRYFGSFVQKDRVTLILEYADGGNLADYLKKTPPPSRPLERFEFWNSFFMLLKALNATHNMTALSPGADQRTWRLKGVHQDIRPQNILVKDSNSSDYLVHFLLTDFGTGHVRKHRASGLDTLGAQHRGNGMYSAPESRRDDCIPKPQLGECDIWSLGGVASELLVWSIQGDAKRQEYQKEREKATKKTDLVGGFHEGSFHDGECRLPEVDAQHQSVLDLLGPDDVISPIVSQIILDCMLVANPAERWNASEILQEWNESTQSIRMQRQPNRESVRSSSTTFSGRHSLMSMTEDLQLAQTPPMTNPQWLPFGNLMSTEPAAIPSSRRPTNHIIQSNESSSVQRNPPIASSQSPRPVTTSLKSPIRVRPHHRFSTPAKQTTQSVDDWLGITDEILAVDSPMAGQHDHQKDVGQHRRPFQTSPSPSHGPSNTISSHHKTVPAVTPQQPSSSGATITSESISESLAATVPLGRTTRHSGPIITVDELYRRINSESNKVGWIKRNLSPAMSKQTLLSDYPRLAKALNQLKGYDGRDQIFLIDDASSMSIHKYQLARTVRVLSRVLKLGEVDPNKTFELYWTCSSNTFSHKDSRPLEQHVELHQFSEDQCHIYGNLESVTRKVLAGDNPVSIYILTNGRWNCPAPQRPDQVDAAAKNICKLDALIRKTLINNENKERTSNHVGIQFIRFYQPNNLEDEAGKKRLKYLDDSLAERFTDLDPAIVKKDIIDTRDWDDDICNILLGGVFEDKD